MMFDPVSLAATTVAVLVPLLQKALEKGVEKLGESTAGSLFEQLKKRLRHDGAQEALTDLSQQPADADNQAALRKQLGKALAADPELAQALQNWLPSAASLNIQGDHNKVAQVSGQGNSVQIS
jgi:hypothetical protein